MVTIDSEATCCAFDIFSEDSNFLSGRQWARSLDGQHDLTGQ